MKLITNISFLLAVLSGVCLAQEASDTIITKQGVSVSTAEIDAFLLTIPESERNLFAANPQRLLEAIDGLVINKVAYQDALENNIEALPAVKAKVAQAERRIVLEAWLNEYVRQQPEADYEAIAQEKYILNKDEYVSQDSVDVKHILIAASQRSAEEAHAQAQVLLQRIQNDEISFDEAAAQNTEDPTYRQNNGLIEGVREGATAPAFEAAAFALTADQPLSDVVDTRFGSHILYLVERNPSRSLTFDEIREQLIAEAREEHKSKIINDYLSNIRKQDVTVNQEVLNKYLESHRQTN